MHNVYTNRKKKKEEKEEEKMHVCNVCVCVFEAYKYTRILFEADLFIYT